MFVCFYFLSCRCHKACEECNRTYPWAGAEGTNQTRSGSPAPCLRRRELAWCPPSLLTHQPRWRRKCIRFRREKSLPVNEAAKVRPCEDEALFFYWSYRTLAFLSVDTSRWGTADAEIKDPSVEKPELTFKPGDGPYIAMHATHTDRDFFLAAFYRSSPFTCIFFSKTFPSFSCVGYG